MSTETLAFWLNVGSAVSAGLLAFAWASYLAAWLSPRITPRVPIMRWWAAGATSAAATVALSLAATGPAVFPVISAIVPILVLSTFVDAKTKRIPNAYVIQSGLLALASAAWLLLAADPPAGWWTCVAGAAAIAGVTFVATLTLNIVSRGGLGMGDVKLASTMALFLVIIETWGWTPTEIASFIAPALIALVACAWLTVSFLIGGLYVIFRGLAGSKTSVPFGPFLVLGFGITVAATPIFHTAIQMI